MIVTPEDEIAGHIEFFKPVNTGTRSSSRTSCTTAASPGRGYTTEAVQLLVDYLFGAKKQHRDPTGDRSRRTRPRSRIAEKCGFTLEGTARGAFFNGGRNQDVLIYSLLRDDPRPWHGRRRHVLTESGR